MSDPQHYSLDELAQRLQALSELAAEPRLRSFQGAPLPIGPAAVRPPAYGAFEDVRQSPPPPPPIAPPNAAVTAAPVSGMPPAGNAAPPPLATPPAPPFGAQYPSQPTSYQTSAVSPVQTPPFQPSGQTTPATFTDYGHGPGANGSSYKPAASVFPETSYTAPAYPPTPAQATQQPLASGSPPHPYGAPPPTGSTAASAASPSAAPSPAAADPVNAAAAQPLHGLAPEDPNAPKSGLQKAVAAVRSAIPVIQRLLPLLDGNFAAVLSSLVTTQPHHPPPPVPKVDLEPMERGLSELRTSHRDLKTQLQDQGTSLKRVEDHLERVREATDRNTLEQQELVEDLRSVGSRLTLFAIIGLVLLLLSVGLNVFFLVELQHILR